MSAVMKKLSVLLVSVLLVNVFAFRIFADVAPDPITRSISYLPFILIAAVVIVALVLIKKFFKK